MLRKRIFFISVISVISFLIIFTIIINGRIKRKSKGTNDYARKINNIAVPIYPQFENLVDLDTNINDTRIVLYSTHLNYPSRKVYEYYDEELKKIGFELNTPPSYTQKLRDWNIGFGAKMNGTKKQLHAQFESFWLNKQKKQIAELTLVFDWKIDESASLVGEKKIDIQYVLYKTTFLEKDMDIENLDIYEFYRNSTINGKSYNHFTELSSEEIKKVNIISIPIYPIAENLIEKESKNEKTREVQYIVHHDFFSEDVYRFYDKVLKKYGYVEHFPKSYPSPIKKWVSGYENEEDVGKKIFFNQLDTFWVNKIRNQISMLSISSKFEVDENGNPLISKDKIHQQIIYKTTVLDDKHPIDKLDIFKYYLNKL